MVLSCLSGKKILICETEKPINGGERQYSHIRVIVFIGSSKKQARVLSVALP